jgi:hypothetical protein
MESLGQKISFGRCHYYMQRAFGEQVAKLALNKAGFFVFQPRYGSVTHSTRSRHSGDGRSGRVRSWTLVARGGIQP